MKRPDGWQELDTATAIETMLIILSKESSLKTIARVVEWGDMIYRVTITRENEEDPGVSQFTDIPCNDN